MCALVLGARFRRSVRAVRALDICIKVLFLRTLCVACGLHGIITVQWICAHVGLHAVCVIAKDVAQSYRLSSPAPRACTYVLHRLLSTAHWHALYGERASSRACAPSITLQVLRLRCGMLALSEMHPVRSVHHPVRMSLRRKPLEPQLPPSRLLYAQRSGCCAWR